MPDYDRCPWLYNLTGGAQRVTDREAYCNANPTGSVCATTWVPRPSGGKVTYCAVGRTLTADSVEVTAEPDPPPSSA